LAIGQFLPKEGSMAEQLVGKSIMEKTLISKEEMGKLRFDPIYQGKIDPETDFLTEFEFSENELELMFSEFLQRDKERKINSASIGMALKIRDAKKQQ